MYKLWMLSEKGPAAPKRCNRYEETNKYMWSQEGKYI